MQDDIDAITHHARDALGFLEREPGCRFTAEDLTTESALIYVFPALTFELLLDWQERITFLLVGRTTDGARPPGSYLHEGRVVRIHLHKALAQVERAAALRLIKAVSAVPPDPWRESLKRQITCYAEVLRSSLDRLLARGAGFFEPSAEGDRPHLRAG